MKLHQNSIKLTLLSVLIVCASASVYGQLSKVHYIPPISISQEQPNNTPREQWLYISTPSQSSVFYTVTAIGGASKNFVVSKDAPMKHDVLGLVPGGSGLESQVIVRSNLGTVVGETGGTTPLNDKGFIIEADQPIYVSLRISSQAQAGALVSKGESALGEDFLLGSFANTISTGSDVGLANFFSILATENNTIVEVQFPKTVVLENYTGTYPLTITLDKNESYVGLLDVSTSPGNHDGLLGARIISNNPIVVNTGSASGTNASTGNGRDFGIDQIVDTKFAGDEYIFVRGAGDNDWENVLIVPTKSGTSIEINNGSPIAINNAYYIIEGSSYIGQSMHVKSNEPVVAYQGIGGRASAAANQGMFYVPPLNCNSRGDVNNIPFIDEIGSTTLGGDVWRGALAIVAKAGATVEINNGDVSLPAGVPVSGNTSYVTYVINNINGSYSIKSNAELYVSYYTYAGAATSGSFYSGFLTDPFIQSDINASLLGTCVNPSGVSNTTLTTTSGFDNYSWERLDVSSGLPIVESNTKNFTPTVPGMYRLVGNLNCFPGKNYTSDYISVSLCPDDADNDGIPDTIDMDRDNDGILNEKESFGNGTIDFSDPLAPIISLPDNPSASINRVATLTKSATSDFLGAPNGALHSTINFSGLDEKTAYELNPILNSAMPINIRLSEVPGHVLNDFETITIEVYPPTENVSLVDLGGKLLAEIGGEFRLIPDGVITGNRLRFKYNPTPTSSSIPFEIVGVNIEGIKLEHELFAAAVSKAELKLTMDVIDYKKNTDASFSGGDLKINSLDQDSDADGCDDLTESGLSDFLPSAPPFTFTNGTVDARGRILFSGMTGYPEPQKDSAGNYLYLTPGAPITILASDQPSSISISEGDQAVFSVGTVADSYQWQMNGVDITDDAIFSGTTTNTLTVNTVDTTLDGNDFAVLVNSNTYLCKEQSNLATLSVLALPTAPILNKLYSFCKTATVADLKTEILNTNPGANLRVYANENDTTPLNNLDPLVSEQDYYVATYNSAGGESIVRSMTIVIVPDPSIIASTTAPICPAEQVTLNVSGVPQTVAEFESKLDSSYEKFTTYGDSHYFVRKQAMTWTAARNLIKAQGAGASMYMIDSKAEETAVYNALVSRGLTTSNVFWLGLRQIDALKNGQVDQGWVWLDGRPLDPSEENWGSGEPNDSNAPNNTGGVEDGDEDFGQFNFANLGMVWNDMADNGGPSGNSLPIFEFTGTTSVKWYKQEAGGGKVLISGTSNEIKVNPTVTTTYFYEVEANGLPCDTSITITVNTPPTMLPANDMNACDNNLDGDPTNANEATFDLDQQKLDIIGIAADREVLIFGSNANAQSLSGEITSSTYTTNPQTLYYRIKDTSTGCISAGIGSFDLIIDNLPPELNIPDLHECDDNITGNDSDGEHLFDLTKNTSVIESLLGSSTAFEISYHANSTDAITGASPITSYQTLATDLGIKEIFVRIKNKTTGCVRYDNSFDVVVDKLPELKTTSIILEQCQSAGAFKYDLTTLEPKFTDNYATETFRYYEDPTHTIAVADPSKFTATTSKKIYLVISNATCERKDDLANGASEIVIDLTIGVNSVPPSFSSLEFTYCFDSVTSTTPGVGVFDPTIFTDIETAVIASNSSYGSSSVELNYYETEQDAIYQKNKIDTSLPYTNNGPNSSPYDQEIWVGIEDVSVSTIKCLGRFKVADLKVRPNPTFDLPTDMVFCRNFGTETITITNPGGSYIYNWTLNGVPQTSATQNLTITQGGTYTVTATNPSTGCATTKAIAVSESEIAAFMPEDISVFDLTGDGSNRIEIKTSTLGIGDYEFALNGPPYLYQDSPIFENVPPGIHTLSVREKNGCGIVRLEVSVIGYALYFTPNNDGNNDTWQILGVSGVFQPLSLIYIFDRHGRLMAQIPADGAGWDGTYNGTAMPADDYWFRVKLQDGRGFTGHFSLIR
ncbi:MAG: T9SS type B sorting domain-containing protein [Flavobacteriaceae bacterium]